MAPRTVFLARVIGLFLLAWSVAMVVNKTFMLQSVAAIVHQPTLLLIFSIIALPVGLAMVVGHNVWSRGAAPLVVTLVGWAVLIKSAVLLFASPAAILRLYAIVRFEDFFYGYLAAIALIGLYLAWAGFRPPSSHRGSTNGAGGPAG